MNKARGDMYDWVDYTWNPVKGCEHFCKYCYLRRIPGNNFSIRLSDKELKERIPGGAIFIGSASDMFGEFIPEDWIKKVLGRCDDFFNTYILQTKNPARYHQFTEYFNNQFILGTTIETNREYNISRAPSVRSRASAMAELKARKFITIEPIIDFDIDELLELVRMCDPEFVNVGADSKGNDLPEPDADKIDNLIEGLMEFTEVKRKKNLSRLISTGVI